MSDDVRDYFEEFDYELDWEEPALGHITGRLWEAELPGVGVYVVKRFHGTTVEGHFEPDEGIVTPRARSRTMSFWIEAADHYKKDAEEGWLKAEDAEHHCRLWCEQHAMDNAFIKDVRPKEKKEFVTDTDYDEALAKLRAAGVIP